MDVGGLERERRRLIRKEWIFSDDRNNSMRLMHGCIDA